MKLRLHREVFKREKMQIVKVREWNELTWYEKRKIFRKEIEIAFLGNRLSDQKYILTDLKKYYFDECGQKIYVFNSIVKEKL